MEEVLGNVQALEFVHCLNLLFTLGSCVVESLVLLLDAVALPPDFLLPVFVVGILSLLVFCFELSNLLKLSLLFDFEDSLLYRLRKEHIENRLDLLVVMEEVVVSNLSDFVDSCLLRDVLWSWRFRKENVSLSFDSRLLGRLSALLCEEVGQIDFNPGWCSRTQIIGGGLLLLLFEF